MQLKHCLNFHRNIIGQCSHTHGTPHADTVVSSPHLGEKFTSPIDNVGMFFKIAGAIYHAQNFDDSLHSIQTAQMRLNGREHR